MRASSPLPIFLFSLLLGGCGATWVADDLDGDGYTPSDGDCWDAEQGPVQEVSGADIHPGAEEIWYDGVDQDCDDLDDFDQDGDGWTGAADGSGEDCDDEDPDVNPASAELWYDGVDQDCDGNDTDQDGDGYPVAEDCDDQSAELSPASTELWYDGVDQDCDGNDTDQDGDGYPVSGDCDDTDPERAPDPTIEEIWYNGVDEDCDGNDGDQDGDGYVTDEYADSFDWQAHPAHQGAGDCWDDAPDTTETPEGFDPINGFPALGPAEVGPEAEETWYDGVDQDCDAESDFDQDGDDYNTEFYLDRDGLVGADCIDGSELDLENPAALAPRDINPGASEAWYDGTDQDCAGDDDFDQDTDSYQAVGYGVGSDDDCDDAQASIHPGATEDCTTSADEDCDDETNDEGALGCITLYEDEDGDGFGAGSGACLCVADDVYLAEDDGDCDDADASVYPGADEEVGDEVDQDCDGGEICNRDYDEDGYTEDGDVKISVDTDCDDSREATATEPGGDCDETDEDINPGASEVAGDEVDQDCSGDELCYADADEDGYRTSSTVASTDTDCDDRGEAVKTDSSGDCDDTDDSLNPGAAEVVGDEVDQDCDGDERCYADADRDGYRTTSTVASADADCDDAGEASLSDPDEDCDDSASTVYPGASEVCEDDLVNDCDSDEATALQTCGWEASIGLSALSTSYLGASSGDEVGGKVAFAGDVDGDGDEELLLGAPGLSSDAGAVYLVSGPPESGASSLGSSGAYDARFVGESSSDRLGSGLAGAGDTDGDGYADLLLGAYGDDDEGVSSGAAYVLLGPEPLDGTLSSVIYDAKLTGDYKDNAGRVLSAAGDVDGNGYGDVLVGAPAASVSTSSAGGAFLVLGPVSTSYLYSLADGYSWGGSSSSAQAGRALASGDVDADGAPDVLIGAYQARVSGVYMGKAYVLLGSELSSGELDSNASLVVDGVASGDYLGWSLAAGDVDGDGADDVLVGARGVDTAASSAGACYLILGGSSLPEGEISASTADATLLGISGSDYAGYDVAAGDLTGDGLAEVLIGATNAAGETSGSGVVWLFFGPLSGSLSAADADMALGGISAGDDVGEAIAAGGDADGDSYGDLLLGASGYDPSGLSAGGGSWFLAGTGY